MIAPGKLWITKERLQQHVCYLGTHMNYNKRHYRKEIPYCLSKIYYIRLQGVNTIPRLITASMRISVTHDTA